MGHSLGLAAYLAVSARADHRARKVLHRRLARGKEDQGRSEERLGVPGKPRPPGRMVWFHSASVGEVISVLRVVEEIARLRADIGFLITTGTLSSAELLQTRMPERTLHQYVPYDTRSAVEKFLDYWKPSIGIWTESELWPTLICESHRRQIPLLFVNARMSEKSYRRWRWIPGFAASLLRRFNGALCQDNRTGRYLRRLGLPAERIDVTGSLKRGAGALPCNPDDHDSFLRAVDGRTTWLAASTHEGEEELVGQAHSLLEQRHQGILLVLVPRHPERGQGIGDRLTSLGYRVRLRSKGDLPASGDQIYVADTFGELGLWYRVAPVSFVGGSMVESGGHNPYEPALLESVILHGPHVGNFAQDFAKFSTAGAARQVETPADLANAVDDMLDPDLARKMTGAALSVCSGGEAIVQLVAERILARIPAGGGANEAA